MWEHLEALFDLLSRDSGGLSGKFPPSPCGLSFLAEPGGSAALGEIYGSLKAANFAPCWRTWKGFEALVLPQQLRVNSAAWERFMHHMQVKAAAIVGFFGLALCFSFLFLPFMWTRQCFMFFRALVLSWYLWFSSLRRGEVVCWVGATCTRGRTINLKLHLNGKETFNECPRHVWWKSCTSIIGKTSVWGEMGIPFSRVKFLFFITQVLFLLSSRSCSFPNVNLSSQLHSNELWGQEEPSHHHTWPPLGHGPVDSTRIAAVLSGKAFSLHLKPSGGEIHCSLWSFFFSSG